MVGQWWLSRTQVISSSSQEIKDKGTIGRGLVVGKYLLFYSLDVPRHEVFGVFFNAYDT